MFKFCVFIFLYGLSSLFGAESLSVGDLNIELTDDMSGERISNVIKVFLLLTVLSLAPSILIVMTSFTRIILVLSMLRQALGMQQTPPNTVLISLALFLTLFSMMPVLKEANEIAYQPLSKNEISLEEAFVKGIEPFKVFMLKHTREQDLSLMLDLSNQVLPSKVEDIELSSLIPAFMISELITAFKIGFMIFLPFLLVDIVVASLLMAMGMMMVPPMMMSLPIKILLFVLIDGWNLVVKSLMGSF
jgi:flagellar biosynthetic protein FliP